VSLPLVSAGGNVNRLLELLPGHILGQHRIDPPSYDRLTYGYRGGASKNWDAVTAATDLAAAVNGWPTSHPLSAIEAWLDKRLADRRYLLSEGSLLSPIYFYHHTWSPFLVILWATTELAERDPRWSPYPARLRAWLRAGIGFSALAGWPVRQRSWPDAARASFPKAPGVAVATAKPLDWMPPVTVAACGRRGWDLGDGGAWLFTTTAHPAAWLLAEFGLDVPVRLPNGLAETLRRRGFDPTLLSPAERERVGRAIGNSVDDLRWVVDELLGGYVTADPVEIVRTTGGVASALLSSSAGPTSALVAMSVEATGRVHAMGVDSPHRGSGAGSVNRAHEARVDLGARAIFGQATGDLRGYPAPLVRMPIPGGDVVLHLWIGPGGVEWAAPKAAPPPPPPLQRPEAPSPDVAPADAFDWLANAAANLAAVGPGWFSIVSPIVGHPDLFAIRKSDGARPFSTELLWRDADRDRIALVAECGYGPAGELANLRTFWADDGRPGITWLPRWIDRTAPTALRVTGQLVETAITADGAPYRPDGTRLAAGEWQQAKVDADTVVEHVGVTDQLGEQAAVLRRTDTMGDRAHPDRRNREVYEIAFGRGAFGYVAWQSYRAGQLDREGRATGVATPSAPCAVAGIDPLDPECRERWFATPGHAEPLPRPFAPTRRPAAAKAEREGRSWLEWFLDWLGL
jgi:hypothetical protein